MSTQIFTQIVTQHGDSIDAICYRHYRSHAAVDEVLERNAHLAALGSILPVGTSVSLPVTPRKTSVAMINLWD